MVWPIRRATRSLRSLLVSVKKVGLSAKPRTPPRVDRKIRRIYTRNPALCEYELALKLKHRVEPCFPKTAINWWLCCDKYSVTSGALKEEEKKKKSKGCEECKDARDLLMSENLPCKNIQARLSLAVSCSKGMIKKVGSTLWLEAA